MRVWAAVLRRDRSLDPAAATFEAAVPHRIRGDESFQRALEDAQTAESLGRAVAAHEGEIKDWAAKGVVLLRAVESVDRAYQHELSEALHAYRESITEGKEEGT
jgi:uracil DNA glycosylase